MERGEAHGRFTPTCVGTMPALVFSTPAYTVHPHVRGDNEYLDICHGAGDGSPPRAWGQFDILEHSAQVVRFTPTCVGTIRILRTRSPPRPVHPHVRGDNDRERGGDVRLLGSPPRAWGQWSHGADELSLLRFTPTCVGTMRRSTMRTVAYPVHPHVRGDNLACLSLSEFPHGSPPRAWGQCATPGSGLRLTRFTPTCVGTI